MLTTSLKLLLVGAGIALAGRVMVRYFESVEARREITALATIKAVHIFKRRLKPGIYTFQWVGGQLQEPKAQAGDSKKTVLRFVNGDRVYEKVAEMPPAFQRELLEVIKRSLAGK